MITQNMEVTEKITGSTDINTYITSAFKCLLADEFIIMNKTASCLLDVSSPFNNLNNTFLQTIYDDVRKNSEQATSALRVRSKNLCITIEDIVTNTSLKKRSLTEKAESLS